ncbi:ubiquitin carboxyl-terminal hydrolase, partial [Trifolium pratense]
DKIGEQQQHQNFPDESTSESTSSTWIGKNLIVEDDIKSPHVVDSPHSRLIERPPELIFRRGAIFPREPSASGLTIISDSVNAIAGSCEEKAISEDQLANWDKVNNESGNGQVLIKICPEVI